MRVRMVYVMRRVRRMVKKDVFSGCRNVAVVLTVSFIVRSYIAVPSLLIEVFILDEKIEVKLSKLSVKSSIYVPFCGH